ncbi:DUF397 domain-containing protein [Streptomyces sp. B93]|uniref:DUF397 domain-containing protein n=1 Tax=Streptomyces sp. B93 TaxID=2824875 RepID=UPI0027E56313|nr:DUF397 domain-containing protein [Streptomyces sp. B93]
MREGAALAEDRGAVSWRKSSYSGTNESACCEVARLPGAVHVRDSKFPYRAELAFTPDVWCAALALFSAWGNIEQSDG